MQYKPLNIGAVSVTLVVLNCSGATMEPHLYTLTQEVLRTDVAGMPLEWIDYRIAATLYHSGQVAYACGSPLYKVRGGINARTGSRSIIEVSSIIATHGDTRSLERSRNHYTPPLNNRTLFKRDANVCMYCAERFRTSELTRDHITPLSRGGLDVWTNVVTACRRCNNHKGGKLPEEANLQLVAVPFTPTYAEYIYLKGRRVLADQMEYLLTHFPRSSPLHARLSGAIARFPRPTAW
jgi:5-methylcytosine-specific restriction endonuclease McrA